MYEREGVAGEEIDGEMRGTCQGAGSGLARIERPIRSFSWSQTKGVRMATSGQAPTHIQTTKQVKIGFRKLWPELPANQTHTRSVGL